jgi:NAD(P)-dependent dehydrogenase (short-subunit alcohol dehydrogenase family)
MRVVIMGGTAGIGLATARHLAATGAEVTVTGRDPERLAAAKPHVTSAEQLDGTDLPAVADFFTRHGDVDHLVLSFSPGAAGLGPIRATDLSELRAAFDGKLFPYLHAVQHAHVTGSITFVTAASARAALPGTVALAGVNGALERIVPPLAAELSPVRVNAVAPGAVDTAWWNFLPADARAAQFADAAANVPARRIATPDDVAGAIAYLISATLMTGVILPADGGFTVSR